MSIAKFDTLQNAAGSKSVPVDTVVDGTAKAWVNFNGTGTVAIRASFNVSSITDNGVGSYTINFTNPMSDANYAAAGCATDDNAASTFVYEGGTYGQYRTTSAVRMQVLAPSVGLRDQQGVYIAIFR